jgi:hypothetical protein
MQLQLTDNIAIYAAVVSTLVLVWDIVKWMQTGSRLRLRATCNVAYGDSRVTRTTQKDNVQVQELEEYCHIEVTNIGDQPETILGLEATHKTRKHKPQMFCSGQKFTPHYGKILPYVLTPGEVWSARIDMQSIDWLAEYGKVFIQVTTSSARKPRIVVPKFKARPSAEKHATSQERSA